MTPEARLTAGEIARLRRLFEHAFTPEPDSTLVSISGTCTHPSRPGRAREGGEGMIHEALRLAAALGAFVVLAALAMAFDDSGPMDPPPYYEERTMDGPRP